MNNVIEKFLANIKYLHELNVENLPQEVIDFMIGMDAEELFKTCTQFVVLQNNIPDKQKLITLNQDELLKLVEEYGKKLLQRVRG
ncbi:MAG TPA: hypothetical protein CFH79_01175 [Sulfurospirillum sp. UBA11407]|nr:MAG TPA: hypothetical protein CFH79_01175 [Sulfurospirillum sp. UBA11407]